MKVPDEKELLAKELKSINWNQVDEYPTVEKCDSLVNKSLRKQCFFDYMTNVIQQKLDGDSIKTSHLKSDTIQVVVTVLTNATVQFKSKFSKDSLVFNEQRIDSILKLKLTDFPKINPAIKQGIPVKSQFVLPVILNYD